eukprot:TRINITY_DN6859_c0_g1_i2.p1 TRINITY_DN6859_c0_g1~~TRINITY_DN6859_c0_g1_i2.p1  ORF type:complete len:238 (+),score=7.03 TRINITY_DN6859_c0_g1_i2:146-859(+)
MIKTGHPFRVSDEYIRQLDIAGINVTGERTYQSYFNEFVKSWNGERCLGKKLPNKDVVSYGEVKEAFFILFGTFILGFIFSLLGDRIGKRIHFWESDNLAGRRYLILFDGMTAVTTRHLIASMIRIHNVSRPKNAAYFAYIRSKINPLVFSKASKRIQEETFTWIPKSALASKEIENLSFSSFELSTCGKIIRSSSMIEKKMLCTTLRMVYERRKWIYTVLFLSLIHILTLPTIYSV